jgi:ethanolamine utilization protein EutA
MHDHHDGPEPAGEERDHLLWTRDRIRYISVGIDVGSATTQVVFTDIEMRRLGRELSSRYVPVVQDVLYASPIVFTPYRDADGIDADAVAAFVRECYGHAGQTPSGVRAGVVLVTGNALLQRNARSLAERLAEVQGDFVCHGAGHDMEARIATHGSGAVDVSRRHAATVLNIDVGGGTTKLALVKHGDVVATAALGVGSRSVVLDGDGAVLSTNAVADTVAEALGIDLAVGARPSTTDLTRLAEEMIAGVGDAIHGGPGRASAPLLTERLPNLAFDIVVASGGVAEYLSDEDSPGHGDLGWFLGIALRQLIDALGQPLHRADAPIRATVLGSARDTVQLSGNTIFISDPDVLPRRNIPLVDAADHPTADTLHDRLGARAAAIDVAGAVALVIGWDGMPTQRQLLDSLNSVVEAMARHGGSPLVVLLLDQDLGHITGRIATHELALPNALVCVDGISAEGLDYIDVAALDPATGTLQVTMKSLLFGSVDR